MFSQQNQTAANVHIQTKDHTKREVPYWCHHLHSPKRVDGHWWDANLATESLGGLINTKSLIVWDQFHTRLTDKVKQRTVRSFNTDIALIPGDLTSILQPFDMSINHPFKCKLCELWSAWVPSSYFQWTAAGNLKQPSLPVITQWVKTAWDSIDLAIITKSFKKYSIINDLDGTEDDVLWDKQHDKSDSDEEGDDMYDNMMTHEQI